MCVCVCVAASALPAGRVRKQLSMKFLIQDPITEAGLVAPSPVHFLERHADLKHAEMNTKYGDINKNGK
jgi:hypothetical protein